jgi:ribosome maturation factor RimP
METNELERIVASELAALGFECVKLEIVGTTRSPIVRMYIDKPGGVSIKDCAMVSRNIGLVFERVDPFPGRYLLEVSSPGNNRPLTREEHFTRFVGKQARVQCVIAGVEKKTYTGNIRSCINGMLVLDTDEGQQLIRLSDVVKANLSAEEYKIDKKMKDTRRTRKSKGGPR